MSWFSLSKLARPLTALLWIVGGCTILLRAAPFERQIEFTQPDGTRIWLLGRGDEFSAVFETLDGYTVVFDQASRAYCYARRADDGQLVSTGVLAHRGDPAALGLSKGVRMGAEARKQMVMARWQRWEQGMQVQKRWQERLAARRQWEAQADTAALAAPNLAVTGVKVGLTLLIDFVDDPATVPQADIVNFCNGDNYTGYGNNGSVKSYYYDNSGGLLTYTNVVTLYIRAPKAKSYYNVTTNDCGAQANILIKDALDTMKALTNYTTEILPQFAGLTVDSSSEVVAFNVFYAGGNGGVWTYGLWPHSWSLYNVGAQELSAGGKKVFNYQVSNIGGSLELGTFCHENGHMLCGYPDIYDYDYDSVGGAGAFCLMDYGGGGSNPAQICAYLKRASGWATTTELNSGSSLMASVTAAAGTNFNHFYRFQKPGVATEYLLVENRQQSGRDAGIPGAGVAVWHVDELGDHNNQSTNYNTTNGNYEVTLVQADNRWDFERNQNSGDANDLYYEGNSAAGYSNEFSDTTSPSARWWDGSGSGVSFSAFSANGATMTFRVGAGPPPLSVAATILADGNTNGVVDFNETCRLWIVLRNDGVEMASNVTASLTTATPGVFLLNSAAGFPDAAPGQLVTNTTPFLFYTTSNFVCGATISLAARSSCTGRSVTNGIALSSGLAPPPVRADNNEPLTIPDLGTVTSTNYVMGFAGAVAKVVVSLYLTHTYDRDLVIDLIAPDNTTNTLVNQRGSSGDNFGSWCSPDANRTTFDDEALQMVSAGVVPFVGSFQPEQPLSIYAGKSGAAVNGAWVLRIRDTAQYDTGTLQCWSLQLATVAACVNGGATPPVITAHPQSILVNVGSNATFNCTAAGTGVLRYQWQFNGVNIPGATNNSWTVGSAQPANEGAYTAVVIDEVGGAVSTAATLGLYREFGRAPAPYPTLLAAGGARHLVVPGYQLGLTNLASTDGRTNVVSEDGVMFSTPLEVGELATVQVVASAPGWLNAWIDFNTNRSWADAGELCFSNVAVAAGTNMLSLAVPASAVVTTGTWARFRFSSVANLTFVGEALDGEVEDYLVALSPSPAPTVAVVSPAGSNVCIPSGIGLHLQATAVSTQDPAGLSVMWSQIGGPGTVTFGSPGFTNTTALFSAPGVYTLRFSASDSRLRTAGTNLAVSVGVAPVSWTGEPVGTVAAGTGYALSNGVVRITAGGVGIQSSGTADDFFFIHQAVTGDAQITARIVSVQNIAGSASRAGVMIRESAARNAREAFMGVTAISGGRSIWRSSTGGTSGNSTSSLVLPCWVRVARVGNVFTVFSAPDLNGAPDTWTQLGSSHSIAMTNAVRIGLAAASGSTATNGNVVIDNVTITPPQYNTGPLVNAGSGQTTGSATLGLNGTATDDGLPATPGVLTTSWSKVSGPGAASFTDASATNTTATFTAFGTYVLRLTASDGLVKTFHDTVISVSDEPPVITRCATNRVLALVAGQTWCVPDLTGEVIAVDPFSAVTVTQSPPPAAALNMGTNFVTLHAMDTTGHETLCQTVVTLADQTPPVITLQPQSRTNVTGTEAAFSVTATGLTVVSYQWCFGPTLLVGATNATLTLAAVNPTNAGSYSVVASSQGGATTSEVAVLTVLLPQVTGWVAMEAYVGPARDGRGTRTVTFKATDIAGTVLRQWSRTLDFAPDTNGCSEAAFSLDNVPVDTSFLSAKTAWHLRGRLAVTFSNGEGRAEFTGSNALSGGDLDGSNLVDIEDYFRLGATWLTPSEGSDIDGSGSVDMDDYQFFVRHWYEAGSAE